jgi:AcrR family transcriptional regulator
VDKADIEREAASDALSANRPRPGQRERLVAAMTELAARRGYSSVSIADVSARAGVSSATFYEQFADKEDCLLGAYRAASSRMLSRLGPFDGDHDWREASSQLLSALLSGLQQDPDGGRLMLVEALAGGARLRAERAQALAAANARAQEYLDAAKDEGRELDLPATIVMQGVRSVVARNLRARSEDLLMLLIDDLLAWIEAYAIPAGARRWSSGRATALPARTVRKWTKGVAEGALAPQKLPRGRHRIPHAAVERSQRTRILFGTSDVVVAKGYAAATVSDIVAAAGISRDVFYGHFSNKQDAYLAAQQYGTEDLLEACAAAYFQGRAWPERVWLALRVLVLAIAANPNLAFLRIVECYAAGPAAIEQTEQLKRAATTFLQEGFTVSAAASKLPRLTAHAITWRARRAAPPASPAHLCRHRAVHRPEEGSCRRGSTKCG